MLEAFLKQELCEVENYVKATNLLICYGCILCREDCTIEDWALALVEDPMAWSHFPWGSYSFQMIEDYIKDAEPKEGVNTYRLYGPFWAIQFWALETFPSLHRFTGNKVSDTKLPRCLRWEQTARSCPYGSYGSLFDQTDVSFMILHA